MPPPFTLSFSYDEVLLLAQALEHWIASYRAVSQIMAPALLAEVQQQIAQADQLLGRLNEARR